MTLMYASTCSFDIPPSSRRLANTSESTCGYRVDNSMWSADLVFNFLGGGKEESKEEVEEEEEEDEDSLALF
jgi:hypothetical protein